MTKEVCPLCLCQNLAMIPESGASSRYAHCKVCDLRFLLSHLRLPTELEKKRYLQHQNTDSDTGYVSFLSPLVEQLRLRFPRSASGLDFGAGPGPVLASLLKKEGFSISIYDPFFWPDKGPLADRYDFVTATEVVEHFFSPAEEFKNLRKLLKPGGSLALMTALYETSIPFQSWHYRRDPTHVSFYSQETFRWIANEFQFDEPVFIEDRIVLLTSRLKDALR